MSGQCKGVHCVDLGESFPTSIYLHNLASIQPRMSLVKFARSPRTDRPGYEDHLDGLHIPSTALHHWYPLLYGHDISPQQRSRGRFARDVAQYDWISLRAGAGYPYL